MARVALPQSKIRQRRKQRRIRIALFGFASFIFLAGAVVGASWLGAVRISEVRVEGVALASKEDVASFVRTELEGRTLLVFPKNSVFLYPQDELVEKLQAAFPALHSVRIRAQVPSSFHTLVVSVAERTPHALWCGTTEPADCSFVDNGGVVYAAAPQFSDAVYVRYVGKTEALEDGTYPAQFTTPGQFASLSALVTALQGDVGPIDVVSVEDTEDVIVAFLNGFSLFFSLKDDGGDVFERFTIARGTEPLKGRSLSDFQYLDLRFGDKLYYKLKTE